MLRKNLSRIYSLRSQIEVEIKWASVLSLDYARAHPIKMLYEAQRSLPLCSEFVLINIFANAYFFQIAIINKMR